MHLKKSHLIGFIFLFLLFFSITKTSIAQTDIEKGKIIAFHPSVGNAITIWEKKEFNLFTEYTDSLFQSAELVKYANEKYTVLVKTTNGQSFEKPIFTSELDTIYSTIEKIKPAPKTNTDDYFEDKAEREARQKRVARAESVQMIAEISFQIIFVLLEILAYSY